MQAALADCDLALAPNCADMYLRTRRALSHLEKHNELERSWRRRVFLLEEMGVWPLLLMRAKAFALFKTEQLPLAAFAWTNFDGRQMNVASDNLMVMLIC